MVVVADATPLRYLLVIGHVDILRSVFRSIIIPSVVREELSRQGAPELVRNWVLAPPAWLSIHPHRDTATGAS